MPAADNTTTTSTLLPSPLPTPHWGTQTGSAFTVRATTTTIHASAPTVLETLLDTSRYPEWNNFVPRVTFPEGRKGGRLGEGVTFIEHVDMFGRGKPSGIVKMKLLMTMLEEEVEEEGRRGEERDGDVEAGDGKGVGKKRWKVVWLGKGYPDWALRSERVHVVERHAEEETRYDVYETFSGPLAALVRLFVGGALVKRFGQWNRELKAWVEREGGGSGS